MLVENTPAIIKTSYVHTYENRPIPYTVLSNSDGSSPIGTIIFLGTVQVGKLAEWVMEGCPPNTIVVQGAPHWFAESDGSDIRNYVFDFTEQAFKILLKNFPITKAHVIAESQAVPGVLGLFAQGKYASYLKKMTLLQPLGLNSTAYQGTDTQRVETLRRRIAANFLYQVAPFILDKRLRYNHRLLRKIVGISLRDAKARAQYGTGLSYDAIPDLKRLYALQKDVVVICGNNDKLFPPAEISALLARNKMHIEVRTVKGVPHSPLATRYGQRLLAVALNS
jgi:pimeloyl-ACP methyl ester carboxylesterase